MRRLVSELKTEKDHMVKRLDTIYEMVESEETLIGKVTFKIQWIDEKERSIHSLRIIMAQIVEIFLDENSNNYTSNVYTQPASIPENHTPRQQHEKDVQDLQSELLDVTMRRIAQGFVRETSFSEKGDSYWFATHQRQEAVVIEKQPPHVNVGKKIRQTMHKLFNHMISNIICFCNRRMQPTAR